MEATGEKMCAIADVSCLDFAAALCFSHSLRDSSVLIRTEQFDDLLAETIASHIFMSCRGVSHGANLGFFQPFFKIKVVRPP